MKLPSAGDLDRLVRIERKATAADPEYVAPDAQFGTANDVWLPLVVLPGSPVEAADLWAQILDALPSRSESVQQGLEVARNQTRVRMRWRNDVDSSMRIVERDGRQRTLQIVGGPAELGRREFMELVCETVTS